MKIGRKRASELLNDEAVYRTAPATPGLLKKVLSNVLYFFIFLSGSQFSYWKGIYGSNIKAHI